MKAQRGFTLVELITVIVLLAIVAGFSFQFVGIGAQMFTTGAARLQTIEKSRFAVERMTRELRNVVPNSVRLIEQEDIQCLEFSPLRAAGSYYDAPIAPETGNTMTLLSLSSLKRPWTIAMTDRIFIYATQPGLVYTDDPQRYASIEEAYMSEGNGGIHELILTANSQFEQRSSRKRAYIGQQPVSFCLSGSAIERAEGYGWNTARTPQAGLPLANHLDRSRSSFQLERGTPRRHNIITLQLAFVSPGGDAVFYHQEVQIPNAP